MGVLQGHGSSIRVGRGWWDQDLWLDKHLPRSSTIIFFLQCFVIHLLEFLNACLNCYKTATSGFIIAHFKRPSHGNCYVKIVS